MLLISEMRSSCLTAYLFSSALFATAAGFPLAAQESSALDASLPKSSELQTRLEQWVKTRQLISEESAAWTAEKATLAGLNEVRLRESGQLDEFIAAAGDRVTEIDGKRAALSKEESDLKTWRREMEKQVAALESRIRPLLPRFPAPLKGKVEEAIIRLESPDPDQPLQNRTRDILLVLQAYLDFQRSVTVESDIREVTGARRELHILYLGMGQAWYVDNEGKYSGYGVPSASGWSWTEDNSIASRVRTAIDIQARRVAPAFVELPLAKVSPGSVPETK